MITAAADESSLASPGPAGWAWYIDDDRWAAGGWPHGANNVGELTVVLDLLSSTAGMGEELLVPRGSQYVINSLIAWLPGWKRRGWKKGDDKPILSVDLMKQLDRILQGRQMCFEWVRGHAGHPLNETADERAHAVATVHRDGTSMARGPGFPRAEKKPTLPEPLHDDTPEQPALFELPDERA